MLLSHAHCSILLGNLRYSLLSILWNKLRNTRMTIENHCRPSCYKCPTGLFKNILSRVPLWWFHLFHKGPLKKYVTQKIYIFYLPTPMSQIVISGLRPPPLLVTTQKVTNKVWAEKPNICWNVHILFMYQGGQLHQNVNKMVLSRLFSQLKYIFWNNIFLK